MTTDIDHELIDQVLELIPRFGRSLAHSMQRLGDAYGAAGPISLAGESTAGRVPPGQSMPLSMGHVKAVFYLYRNGPTTVGQIAEWLQLSPATISEHIDRMVEAGLVERHINPQDRRQVLVELTPSAEARARHFWELQRLQITAVLSRFSPEERPLVIRTLQSFVEVLESDPERLAAESRDQLLGT